MATPSYTPFDVSKPVVSDTRQVAVDAMRTNAAALRDASILGRVAGWTLATAGGTAEEPATKTWSNGSERLRATFTYSSGYITQIVHEWSNDSGATWSTIATETAAYDGSSNATTGNNSSLFSWMYEWIGKFKAFRTIGQAHIAATGAAVHGLGTLATQAASAVAITGGTASLTYEREAVTGLGNVAASTAINWAAGGYFTATITNAAGTFTHSNLPSGVVGYATLLITNPGVATTLLAGVKWAGGVAPTFTASGKDLITLLCADGATVYGSILKDVK